MPRRHKIAERVGEALENAAERAERAEKAENHNRNAPTHSKNQDTSLRERMLKAAIPTLANAVTAAFQKRGDQPQAGLTFHHDDGEDRNEGRGSRPREEDGRGGRGRRGGNPFGYHVEEKTRRGYRGSEPHVSYGGGLREDREGYLGGRGRSGDDQGSGDEGLVEARVENKLRDNRRHRGPQSRRRETGSGEGARESGKRGQAGEAEKNQGCRRRSKHGERVDKLEEGEGWF